LAISGNKPGNEIQTPLAIVILFGLLTSMLLNMLIVPALYLCFGRPVQMAQEGVPDETLAAVGRDAPALMAGCALTPAPELLPQARCSLPVTERHVMATPVAAVSLTSPAASPRHERSIERLTLQQALELAERVHPDFAAAQAQIESAEGRALQAGLFPNPELVSRIESVPVTGRIIERAEYIVGVSQPAL